MHKSIDSFLKIVSDVFSLAEEEKREKGREILDALLQYLKEKKKTIDSQDLKEVIVFFQELKTFERLLDGEIIKGCQIHDITPHELENYIEEKANFSQDEWALLLQAKEDLALELLHISKLFSKKGESLYKTTSKKTGPGQTGWIKT